MISFDLVPSKWSGGDTLTSSASDAIGPEWSETGVREKGRELVGSEVERRDMGSEGVWLVRCASQSTRGSGSEVRKYEARVQDGGKGAASLFYHFSRPPNTLFPF